jgi:precorrin-6y C5,15-methyltransferase (decarboxylating) CbiE subunit
MAISHSQDQAPAIAIIGCGPGNPQYVTPAARDAAGQADVLIGSRRLVDLFAEHPQRIVTSGDTASVLDQVASIRLTGKTVAVLVSGDPGLFSLARNIVARFGRENCRIVPGVSSVQVAFARLAIDWVDARILSAHGRTPDAKPQDLAACDKIAILAGGAESMSWCSRMAESLDASHAAFLCENLTLADERVREVEPAELAGAVPASLSIVIFVRRLLA